MSEKNRIRLFVSNVLQEGSEIFCTEEQRHYLVNVMRRQTGDTVYVFNGRDGEFSATITAAGKKECVLRAKALQYPFVPCPDIWLLFAPLKKDNTDFVVAKATELGVNRICPVITEYATTRSIRAERLQNQAKEAAEQCRRQDVPEIVALCDLSSLLKQWPEKRKLIYLDETGFGKSVSEVMPELQAPVALLVGPEGGFSQKELEMLKDLPYTHGVSLGWRILRAETAAVAALACWQALCGDWK